EGVGREALPEVLGSVAVLPAKRKNAVERAVVRLLTARVRPRKQPTLTQALKASLKEARPRNGATRAPGSPRERVQRRGATARRAGAARSGAAGTGAEKA